MATDARDGRAPTIAGIATTYEETTLIARGLGISFTTESSSRFYRRPSGLYVPVVGKPPSTTALAGNRRTLTREAEPLIQLVQLQWRMKRPAPNDNS